MKKLFERFWLVFLVILGTAVLDLIFIPKLDIGAGFILAFLYFAAWIIYKMKTKET